MGLDRRGPIDRAGNVLRSEVARMAAQADINVHYVGTGSTYQCPDGTVTVPNAAAFYENVTFTGTVEFDGPVTINNTTLQITNVTETVTNVTETVINSRIVYRNTTIVMGGPFAPTFTPVTFAAPVGTWTPPAYTWGYKVTVTNPGVTMTGMVPQDPTTWNRVEFFLPLDSPFPLQVPHQGGGPYPINTPTGTTRPYTMNPGYAYTLVFDPNVQQHYVYETLPNDVAYTDAANTFTAGPQTVQIDADSHQGLAVVMHSPTQSAVPLCVKTSGGSTVFSIQPQTMSPFGSQPGNITGPLEGPVQTSLDLSQGGSSGGQMAFWFWNGGYNTTLAGYFFAGLYTVFGTNDCFFQCASASTGWGVIEGTALGGGANQGLAIGTAGGGPVVFYTGRGFYGSALQAEIARFQTDSSLLLSALDGSSVLRGLAEVAPSFVVNTSASWTGRVQHYVGDHTANRECLRADSDGTTALVSVGGVAVTAGTTLTVATGATADVVLHGVTYKWPATAGTAGYSLTTDGNTNPCTLSWTNVSGGGGGDAHPISQVVIGNDVGGGTPDTSYANFTYANGTRTVTLINDVTVSALGAVFQMNGSRGGGNLINGDIVSQLIFNGFYNGASTFLGKIVTYYDGNGTTALGKMVLSARSSAGSTNDLTLDETGMKTNYSTIGTSQALGTDANGYFVSIGLGTGANFPPRVQADVTNASTTLGSGVLSDLSVTLAAGAKYVGRLVLFVNNGTAASGLKVDLNGGTATMTSVEFGLSAALGATVGTRTSTALGTAVTLTALADTNDVVIEIPIGLVCNAGGTLIPRFADNSGAGTLKVRQNSYLWLIQTPN